MRCAGAGGVHHYFHKECLGTWVSTCRANRASPTCPVCRGAVQVNVRRLSAYLSGSGSGGVVGDAEAPKAEERGMLEHMLARAKATAGKEAGEDEEWADPFTMSDVAHVGLVGLAATAGFGAAYSGSLIDDLILFEMAPDDTSIQVAGAVGYAAGMTVRVGQAIAEAMAST